MRQLSIIVPKTQLHNLLTYAGQDKSLHLVDVPRGVLPEGASAYEAAGLLAESSSLKNRLTGLISTLGAGGSALEKLEAPLGSLDELAVYLDKEVSGVEQAVRQHEDSAGKLLAEQEKLQEISRFLTGLEQVGVSIDTAGGQGFAALLAGEAPRENLQPVQRAIDSVTYGNAIFAITGSQGKNQTFLAIFPSAFLEEARQASTSLGAKLEPSMAELPTDPAEAKNSVKQRIDEVALSKDRLDIEWKSYTQDMGPRVKGLNTLTELFEARAKAMAGASTTQSTIMLRAWVPIDRVQRFIEGASKSCDGLVSVHEEPSSQDHKGPHGKKGENTKGESEEHHDPESKAPTLVRVPSWGNPLQSVINNFGIPSYNETNPLVFMLFTYPIIYGLMFGDFGQGLIFIALGFLFLRMRKKGAKMNDIVQMLANGAELFILLGVGITVFGVVFGDVFGFEHVLPIGPLFSPTETFANLQQFMVITLFIGVAHYSFGLSLSVYNKVHNKEYSEAFFGPVCWIWFYLMGVYLISRVVLANFKFGILLHDPISLTLAVVPLILMGWKEGGLDAFEAFLSAPSNTFSYLRIWALNIADFYFKSALFTAMGILGAVIGNLLVMIIEGLIVFVQTLRLHWVEWFSKFYEGAGLGFAPYTEPMGWIVPA